MTGTQYNDATNRLSDDELKSVTGGEGKGAPLQSTSTGTDKAKTATKEAAKMWAYLQG